MVSGCCMNMCVSVQGAAGTELRDTANTVPRAALARPDHRSANPDTALMLAKLVRSHQTVSSGGNIV